MGVYVKNFSAIQELAVLLKSCPFLVRLDIRGNDIDDSGAYTLAGGLKDCSRLKEVKISSNCFTENGLKGIFSTLKNCNLSVKSEDILSENDRVTVKDLALSLKDCKFLNSLTIQKLSFSTIDFYNYSRDWNRLKELRIHNGFVDFTIFSCCLRNYSPLQVLQIEGVNIDSSSDAEKHHLESIPGAQDFSNISTKECSTLHRLDLRGNNIAGNGAKALTKTIALQCCNIRVLDLGLNYIGDTEIKDLSISLNILKNLILISILSKTMVQSPYLHASNTVPVSLNLIYLIIKFMMRV